MSERHPQIKNSDDVPAVELAAMQPPGTLLGAYGARMRRMGAAAGGQELGCTLYEVEPNKLAFPFHYHFSNEEALIILSGEGTLRLGDTTAAVRAGDYVALPAGKGHAHQLRNTGTTVLRYYCISTQKLPEVAGYPDSKKVGILARTPEGIQRLAFRDADACGYYDDDPFVKES